MPTSVTLSNGVTSSLVPFGDILTAANGDFVAGVYTHDWTPESSGRSREGHVYVIRSKDGGMTWDEVTPIVKDIHVEAAILHTGDSHWLAVSRRFGYLDLDVHASEDDGFTWRHERTLGIPSTSAAHLLRLSDGRIALTYGNRSPGNYGIDLRISEDYGRTWDSPRRLVDLDMRDCGYPAAPPVRRWASTDRLLRCRQ